ncbi:MAG: DNA repair protein RecO [Alphaproteobacteria bacterium]|nr:DNA repair protein RecO [Alphaproteobacteria bacterium]
MKLESTGILIELRPLGEHDSVARIFTRDHGVMCGMLKGAQVSKKNKSLVGQVGNVSWNARVDSQLGVFHWEPEKNLGAFLMMNPKLLSVMNSVFSLIATLLPERENYETLYLQTENLLNGLINQKEDATDIYLYWEIGLLQELGYALDLTRCSGCGTKDNLNYLSPRTGRAVCDNCAKPYLDKLFNLPITVDVTKKFLEKIYEHQGGVVPLSRNLLKL